LYEGYTAQQITFPVRVMKALGVHTLLISSACGGINPNYTEGDLVFFSNHLNLLFRNPLVGPNDDRLGSRWPHMKDPYDPELLQLAEKVARENAIHTHTGVYAGMMGPSGATRPELKFLHKLDVDVYGMSTVPEVIVAKHGMMKVFAMGLVTDMCVWDVSSDPTVEQCLAVALGAAPKLIRILKGMLEQMET